MNQDEQLTQQVMDQVKEFKIINSIWSYYETILAAIIAVVGLVMILNNHSLYGMIIALVGTIVFLYAEIKRLNNLVSFHSSSIWEAVIFQNEALTDVDTTLRTLGLYDKANEILEGGDGVN